MLSKRAVVAALLALSCLGAQGAPDAPRLYLAAEARGATSMRGGSATGIDADKVRAIMEQARVAYTIEVLPWKRAYAAALDRADACVFSTTRTSEREHLFSWVGPLDEAEWVLMGRAGRRLRLRSLEDARPYRIGTYDGDARHQFLRERGFSVEPAPNDMLNPPKLLLDRIDLWAASLRRGSPALARHGWDRKIVPRLVFNRIPVYLACNRGVPAATMARLNEAVAALERDGTLRRIERRDAAASGPASQAPAAPR
jgi:polar amino acid transport system substrate-binding protein